MSHATTPSSPEFPSGSNLPKDAAPAPTNQQRTRQRALLMIAAVVLAIAAVVGGFYYWYWTFYETTDDAFIDGLPVTLSTRVPGQVLRVHVTDNQLVQAGVLLVEIDPCDFAVQVAQANAELEAALVHQKSSHTNLLLTRVTSNSVLEQAQAALSAAQAGLDIALANHAAAQSRAAQAASQVNTAQAYAEQAQAQVAAQSAKLELVQGDLIRYQGLYDQDAATRQQLDHAQSAVKEGEASLQAARKKVSAADAQIVEAQNHEKASQDAVQQAQAQFKLAQAQLRQAQSFVDEVNVVPQRIAVSESQLEAAAAQIHQLCAAKERAELALSYTKIFAPQAGRVTCKTVVAGAFVQVGQPLLVLVPSEVWVTANFKETQLTHMHPGQPAEIRIDAYPGKIFHGHIDSIQAGTGAQFSLLPPENATGNYVKVIQRVPVKIPYRSFSFSLAQKYDISQCLFVFSRQPFACKIRLLYYLGYRRQCT